MPSTTLESVKSILRRDLKLGDDAVIADDMPLAGGDFDIDSLDILLLVTSLEKEFGIKIPNESVSRAAFTSVTTLANFVDSRRSLSGS
ncbi:acyl carrier protein [Phycisphaerales bacterium]|nr:acyl carrier protein [Phycisphaerales bacterium]